MVKQWIWLVCSLRGRIGRKPFWLFVLASVLLLVSTATIAVLTFDNPQWLLGPASAILLWPLIAVLVKRLQDMDCSAWWIYVSAIPYVGVLWLVVRCGCYKGSAQANRFGDVPSPGLDQVSDARRVARAFIVSIVLLTALAISTDTFRIPSNAMLPTLKPGDFVAVNSFSFGIPVPFSLLRFAVLGSPSRGDVVVFRGPRDPLTPYVKRVIGIPGDIVELRGQALLLNGAVINRNDAGVYSGTGSTLRMNGATRFTENLAGAHFDILLSASTSPTQGRWTVAEDQYFVLGDNRDNSHDSRHWGFVPHDHLVGKITAIWFHWDDGFGVDSSRIGLLR